MSNETKRDVLEKLAECYAEVSDAYTSETGSPYYCGDEPNYLEEYGTSLPDDLPVIPKAVGKYIRKAKAPGKWGLLDVFWHLGDNIIYELGKTQSEYAKEIGIPINTLEYAISGRGSISLNTLDKIADGAGLDSW